MLQTIQVEIDAGGQIHPLEPLNFVPVGRALLTLLGPGVDILTPPIGGPAQPSALQLPADKEKPLPEQDHQARIEAALALFREIVKSPPKGRLGPPYLDLTGFKFNRDEANER